MSAANDAERNPKQSSYIEQFWKIVRGIFTGTVIWFGLHYAQSYGYFSRLEPWGTDLYLRLFGQQLVDTQAARSFVFIDIDDAARAEWGAEDLTPRDKLACLIGFAVTAGAKLVIVDVDLSVPRERSEDALLAWTLADSQADAPCKATSASASTAPVPVILQREINFGATAPKSGLGRLRTSFLEGTVAADPHRLYWGATLYEEMPDTAIRNWRLWEAACKEDGTVAALPSVPLLALAILEEGPRGPGDLQRMLDACRPDDCHDHAGHRGVAGTCGVVRLGDRRIDLTQREGRIFYTVPWRGGSTGDLPEVTLQNRGETVPLVLPLPAGPLVRKLASPDGADGALLDDRIVVIGGTYAEARDRYLTPLGPMPGAVIIVNAVHTALQHGTFAPPPLGLEIPLFLFEVTVLAALFHLFSVRAAVIAFFAFLSGTFLLDMLVLRQGIWINMNMASFGIFLHGFWHWLWHGRRHQERPSSPTVVGLALLVLALGAGSEAVAASRSPEGPPAKAVVAWIDSYDGPSASYRIERDGHAGPPVQPMLPLYAGDRIVVDDSVLRIKRTTGEVIDVQRTNSPYEVPAGKPTTWWGGRLLERIGQELKTWYDRNPELRELRSLRVRGENDANRRPDLALLDHRRLLVVEGERDLTLKWRHGKAPYRLRLIGDDPRRPVLDVTGLTEPRLPPKRLPLVKGRYRVEVTDAMGRTTSGAFEVVSRAALPQPPADARFDALPPDVGTVARATWLASLDQGTWALESFLRVAALADKDYQPARIVAHMLAKGELPQL